MRFAILTLALPLAAAVAVSPAAASTFERDGMRFEYSRTDKPGVILIKGHGLDNGGSFSLRVVGGHVTGTMDGTSVAFTISKATMAAISSESATAIAAK